MKRQRYTADLSHCTSNEVIKKVILAYDAESVRAFYERQGYMVLSVAKGDYRKVERNAKREGGGFRFDHAAVKQACDFMGITLPVRLKTNARRGSTLALYSLRAAKGHFYKDASHDDASGGLIHNISVKSYLSPEDASRSLWHELAHAMQAERALAGLPADATMREQFNSYMAAYKRENGGISYTNKPNEVEARSYEQYAGEMPLCR